MKREVIKVEGMSCSHCENAVMKAVGALRGVSTVSVNLGEKTVAVEFDESDTALENIRDAIEDQGYEVIL